MSIDMLRLTVASMTPKATIQKDHRVAINEPRKKGKWRRQGLQGNLRHLSGHMNGFITAYSNGDMKRALDELKGVCVRADFTLELLIEELDGNVQ